MTYIMLGGAGVILLLGLSLVIAIKVASKRGKENAELETALSSAREQLKKQADYLDKRKEAQNNADEKKSSLHTGDNDTDFNNSISVLHGAGKNRGG